MLRKWLFRAAVPMTGVAIVVGAWAIFSSGTPSPVPPEPVDAGPGEVAAATLPVEVQEEIETPDGRPDARWLPNQAKLVFSLRLYQLAARKDFGPATLFANADWGPSVERLIEAFGLRFSSIDRLCWASTDLSDWPDHGVVLIQLVPGQDARAFRPIGETVDLELEGVPCRRLTDTAWCHPYAVLDRRTIVTGREDLLGRLADSSEVGLASVPLDRFLREADPSAEVLAALDLTAARQAGWKLPTAGMDVWPAAAGAWHVVWEMPCGWGLSFGGRERKLGEMALICDGPSAAEEVRQALDHLAETAAGGLDAVTESLTGRVESGRMTADEADSYETVLKQSANLLEAARWEVVDQTVWLRTSAEVDPWALAASAIGSRAAIRSEWLDAARAEDEEKQRHLMSGLSAHEQAEGRFPVGAAGGTLLPPETRLSWIATMLPYYGQRDWHRQLDPSYPWNSAQNRPVTRQRLEAVVNPALGPSNTEAGFPVTHYVGVAGVGADAGQLERDHPRAGMFGFSGPTRREDIRDGTANTLATLGVSGHLGAWASGGAATVRPLTQRPYVNGPDGFGSGQPNGMMAGMADGSVRFLSKDVDPVVLEQWATIAGGEATSVPVLNSTPTPIPATVAHPVPVDLPQPMPPGQKPLPQPPKPGQPQLGDAGEPSSEVAPEAADTVDPATPIDVAARFSQTVREIELPAVPLIDAVELLAQLGGVKVTFDVQTMARLGVDRNDPVTLSRSASSLGEILEVILAQRGLTYVIQKNQVLVTSAEEKRNALYPRPYTVADLTGDDPAAVAELADWVVRLVVPDSWQASGGRGSIRLARGVLNVVQTEAVHYQLLVFCEKLRLARGLPLRSRQAAERFTLATRLGEAAQRLSRPISLNFQRGAPLVRIVSDLEQAGGVEILINWLLLLDAGVGPETTGTLVAQEKPLNEALGELLTPLGLAYRILDSNSLEVTTRKAAATQLELEFFPVGPLIATGIPPESLIGPIRDRLAPATWTDAGGPGVIYFDQPSKHLIVLQSQPIQVEIERLLRALAEKTDS